MMYFLDFLIWGDYTTETFYDQCKDWEKGDTRRRNKLFQIIRQYQDYYMESRGTGFSVCDNIYCAFKKFVDTNDLKLRYFKRKDIDNKKVPKFDYMNVDQVKQVLNQYPSKKVRALILMAKDTMKENLMLGHLIKLRTQCMLLESI